MGKIKAKLIIIGLLFILFISSANAAVTISDDKVYLNVDYSGFTAETQQKVAGAGRFVVQNTENRDVTLQTSVEGLSSDYETTSIPEVTVPANGSTTVEFTVNVPHKEDSGEKNIGTLSIKEGEVIHSQKTLVQKTNPMLILDELKVSYTRSDERSETDEFSGDIDDYQLEEKVRPGTEITFTFKVKNLFDRGYDTDYSTMENIRLMLDIDDTDVFVEDIEDEYELDDIDANRREEFPVTFTVAEDAETTDFTLDIRLEGEDGKGKEHRIRKELTFSVGRERDDVRITKAEITPASVEVCDDSFSLNAALRNFGTRNQRYSVITITNAELGINENIHDIEIEKFSDDEDEWHHTFELNIPENAKAKSYKIDVRTYIQKDKEIDHKLVDLVLKACESGSPAEDEETENENESEGSAAQKESSEEQAGEEFVSEEENAAGQQQQGSAREISTGEVIRTIENPYTTFDFLIAAVIIAIIFVLALIVIFFVLLLK